MTESDWLDCQDPETLLPFLREGSGRAQLRSILSRDAVQRKLRLFIRACGARIAYLLSDVRSRTAVDVAQRFADGLADEAELETARAGAQAAYRELRRTDRTAEWTAAAVPPEALREFPRGGGAFDVATYAAHAARLAVAARGSDADGKRIDDDARLRVEASVQAELLRDLLGNLFRPVRIADECRTRPARELAGKMYASADFTAMSNLGVALQEAGCRDGRILAHCRSERPHAPGCWLVDQLLEMDSA